MEDYKKYINNISSSFLSKNKNSNSSYDDKTLNDIKNIVKRHTAKEKLNYNIEVYEVENSVVVSKIELNNTIDISEIKEKKSKGCVDFID